MENESKNQILREVLKAIEDIFDFYISKRQYDFEEIEKLYEKIVYILSNNNLVKDFRSGLLKADWKDKNTNMEELIENLHNIKQFILFELQEVCLVQRRDMLSGMGSYLFTNLNSIVKCLLNNKIPIIDMRKSHFENVKGMENGWEAFFEQPFGIGLDSIDMNQDLPVCRIESVQEMVFMDEFLYNKELQAFWHKVYMKYMRFVPEVEQYINKEHQSYFENIDINKVCGVLCRGTDYKNLKPYAHPVQPDVEEIIEKVKEVMEYYRCEYIFLATEDKGIYNRFCEEFEGKLLVTKTHMLQYEEAKHLAKVQEEEKIDFFQNNLDYLSALYQLSTLKYFIGGNTSGTLGVYFMSAGFEYSYVWNKGRYSLDDRETLNMIEKIML